MVSKNDLLDEAQRTVVQDRVTAKVPSSVKTTYISNGEAELDVLMGLDAKAEERINHVHNHHDHHHDHGHDHDHAHDHFDSFVITMGEVDSERLQQVLQGLIEEYNIFRAKGFAALPGKPMRQVMQAVGKRLDVYFDRPWAAEETRKTSLVFIGKALNSLLLKRH